MTNDTKRWTGALTEAQREAFLTRGYLYLKNTFDGEEAKAWVRVECQNAGYDLDDPTTWQKPYIRVPTVRSELLATFAPAAWEASCAVMGGEEQIAGEVRIDLMAVNLAQGADKPFLAASPDSPGWHKDGWHFRHFLDSPEQGLLGIPLLTDVFPQGGATFIAEGSVERVARFLAEHPEGVLPDGFPERELVSGCTFVEATGEAGDFYICHPYLMHTVSQNVLGRPRAISNLLYELREPMQFNRPDGNYSLVEAAILRGLGVDHCAFTPTAERECSPDGGPIIPSWRE